MYTIPLPSNKKLDNHVLKLKSKIQDLVKKYHPSYNGETIKKVVTTQALTLDVKAEAGSLIEWFLDWLLVDKNLEKLLRGQIDDLLDIIRTVEAKRAEKKVDEKLVYEKITEKTYGAIWGKPNKKHPKHVVKDIFNIVIYQIFVVEGFDGKKNIRGISIPFFDKTAHVESCKLRICPYCGRSFIYAIDDGSGVVKPQIDHYIPKRKYPYLALSYFNLIPVCSTCNMTACKGDYDPLHTLGARPFRISYPYEFKDGDYEFAVQVRSSNYFDDSNFNVTIDFKKNILLETGSNDVLKLGEFYKYHNHEAANIYRQLMVLKSRANAYYSSFKLPKSAFDPNPRLILGFSLNDSSSRNEILYKFKKDMYNQLVAYCGKKP